ncbi:hypothetical protein WJX84_002186 [Apatococcus fuscideae]|uniref:EF-hand domain-containing protein n=1 Tax=Apatococcus fuscideae TaxID=2026836 RepID=A0AAW1T923_9CHLO
MDSKRFVSGCIRRYEAQFRDEQAQNSLQISRNPARIFVDRAKEGDSPKGDWSKDKKSKEDGKLVESMKKGGLDKATAQRILKVWEETGASSPEGLRKLLLGRSLRTVGTVALQLLLDAGASWGAYSTGNSLGQQADFFGRVGIQYLAYFLGSYFAIGVVFDLFTLGVLGTSAFQYSTNSGAFLKAVQDVAGSGREGGGLRIAEKAATAVNTAKVAGALNTITQMLKEGMGSSSSDGTAENTLSNLSAFLTLQKAEEKGFKASDYGLDDAQAGQIAVIFAKYDLNDDMRLEKSELNSLFRAEGQQLDDNEVKAAIKLLDKNNDGFIEFDEFVQWWQNKVEPKEAEMKV